MPLRALSQETTCEYEFVPVDQAVYLKSYLNDSSIMRKGGFRIVHFGDSHIQADRITGTVREAFQQVGGNGGSGIIFPYSLCGSFGPNGVESQVKGKFTYSTQLKNPTSVPLGVMGYSLSLQQGARLSFAFNENFRGKKSSSITVWIHSPIDTTHIVLDSAWTLAQRKAVGLGIFAYTYESRSIPNELSITANVNTAFWGIGFNHYEGITYQQNGLVGAQFTHLIAHEDHVIRQLTEIKPDLLVFSYGTNEAYENIDSLVYFRKVSTFIKHLNTALPNTGILITNAPDTRSSGRIPQSQILVNQTLCKVAVQSNIAHFDLNKAMGGWGSLHSWSKKGFTLKDQLHFNKEGARVLGLLINHALFTAANLGEESMRDSMKKEITSALCKKPQEPAATETERPQQEQPTAPTIEKPKPPVEKKKTTPSSKKNRVYVVKKGDTLSGIAQKTHTTVKHLMSKNKISATDIIRPGQKLKY
jgi:LysM repeat protein/lysophospholipase L1-like esterase